MKQIDNEGIAVLFDGRRKTQILTRTQLLKAPPQTSLKVKDVVRFASDDHAIEGTTRWEYGRVTEVHKGGELLDVEYFNGEKRLEGRLQVTTWLTACRRRTRVTR